MSRETDFIAALRRIATDPAARGLADDAAVLALPAGDLVATHDMMVEGVHVLAADPPADVAWKLVAVNLSDLAAKGARPLGALLGYPLAPDRAWDTAFLDGLGAALAHFATPLLGGDTVAQPAGDARCFGLTALGVATCRPVPSRGGARAGDGLFLTGAIGDAMLGHRLLAGGGDGPAALIAAYRRPTPRLAQGIALAPHVHAMMDVSDGLLLDAARMAAASGCAVDIAGAAVPFSAAFRAAAGEDRAERRRAMGWGDDYELLFAAPADRAEALAALIAPLPLSLVGRFADGAGITLDGAVPDGRDAPIGWEHGRHGT